MAWITITQADTILASDVGERAAVWTDLGDAEKGALLGRASNRLELVPFTTDAVLGADGGYSGRTFGRFVDGAVPDANGTPIPAQPIPTVLGIAVALLARFFADNVDIDLEQATGLTQDSLIADLPLEVRSAVWPYIIDEAKGRGVLSVLRGGVEGAVSDRDAAQTLVYVG